MKYLNQVQEFLKGKKTHLIAFVLGALNVADALGYISPAHLAQINLVLVALGLSALRAAVKKS